MIARWLAMAAGLALLAVPVLADAVEECAKTRNTPARIAACTEIIKGASYASEQKGVAFRNRGHARAAAGAIEQAIADFDEAIRINGSDAAALAARGLARLGKGEIDPAIADLAAAVQLQPANPAYIAGRGYARLVKGEADHAIADLSEAIRLNPKDAVAYVNRGYAYETKGLKGEAIADFRRAIDIDPTLVGAASGLKRLAAPGPRAEEIDRLVADGKDLVEAHCSRCHAVGAAGASPHAKAPEFRNLHKRHPVLALREPLSRGIAAPHDEMPQFVLPDRDVDKIIAYINSLARPQKTKKK